MSPESQQLLKAIADLAAHAQARPTDTNGIRRLRKARVKAETAWINAGCPDAAQGAAKPSAVPKAQRRQEAEDLLKDWTPVELMLTVIRLTDKGALVADDKVQDWVPRKLCWEPGGKEPADLEEAEVYGLTLPSWLVKEKGFHV